MNKRLRPRFVVSTCLAALCTWQLAACTSMNSLTTARALGKDRWEFVIGLSFAPNFSEGTADLDLPGLPVLDLNARFGLSDNADLGLRLNSMGWLTLDGKVEFYDDAVFTASAKTGFGFSMVNAMSGDGVFQWELDLLVDGHVGADATNIPDATITTIPKYVLFFSTLGGAPRHFLGFELYGKFAADRPSSYVTAFASMLFDVASDEAADVSRVIRTMGNFGVAYTYNDDY